MSKQKEETREEPGEVASPESPDVTVVLAAEAPKLSPRGQGGIGYQVGRSGSDLVIRIEKNHGGGSFSKEWVPVEKIRAAITPAMRQGEPFKSDALAQSYCGRSQCNSGFLVAALRHIGIFGAHSERKGMSVVTGDLDEWENRMRTAEPLVGEDGQPVLVKLHPEPKETRFRPKAAEPTSGDASQGDGEPETSGDHDARDAGDGDAPKRRVVRISRKTASRLGLTPVTDVGSTQVGAD